MNGCETLKSNSQTYYDNVEVPESDDTDLRLEQGEYNFATQQEQNEFRSYQSSFLRVPLLMMFSMDVQPSSLRIIYVVWEGMGRPCQPYQRPLSSSLDILTSQCV